MAAPASRLEVVGWWFSEWAPDGLPLPQRLVAPWQPTERGVVSAYLRAGVGIVNYTGLSFCRFDCGQRDMGYRDFSDGTFVWPEGLAHYVEHHDVRLPDHFVAHVLARSGRIAPFDAPDEMFGLYDNEPWLQWSRAQGACLLLDGWQRPDRDAERRIAAELGAVAYDAIALCKGDTREVVLRLADGSLEVRQLRAGGNAPRRLRGWHEWPPA